MVTSALVSGQWSGHLVSDRVAIWKDNCRDLDGFLVQVIRVIHLSNILLPRPYMLHICSVFLRGLPVLFWPSLLSKVLFFIWASTRRAGQDNGLCARQLTINKSSALLATNHPWFWEAFLYQSICFYAYFAQGGGGCINIYRDFWTILWFWKK